MNAISFAMLGAWESILILMVLLVMAVAAGVVILLLVKSSTRKGEPPQYPRPTSPPPGSKCQRCGATLTANAPQGMCPRCVFEIGLGTQAAEAPQGEKAKAPLPGELAAHFPQFEILELLGQGGMGAVYKARQKDLDRIVALKILPAEPGRDPAFAERFTREARAMAKLSHPNIVTVHEFGQVGQASSLSAEEKTTGRMPVPLYFFVMEFVDGANLRQTLQAQRLSPREAMAIVPQICEALQYAHDQGIVHRDIKPENVLLDKQGRVKIADFGLAKLLGKELPGARLTRSAEVMGTPHYMAPEQLEKPLEVDHRADIYSLGVVFYEMLTGELPLGRFAPPSRKVQVDVRLDEVVLRALEKEPELRYQQASQFKTQVETIASGTTPYARAATVAGTQATWRKLFRAIAPAIVVGLIVFLGTACWFILTLDENPMVFTARAKLGLPPPITDQLAILRSDDQLIRFVDTRRGVLSVEKELARLRSQLTIQLHTDSSVAVIQFSSDSAARAEETLKEMIRSFQEISKGNKVMVFERPVISGTRLSGDAVARIVAALFLGFAAAWLMDFVGKRRKSR